MTSPQAQLQKLLAEIEATLAKASPRLPWVMAGETGEQRRLLQAVRDCLVELQNQGPLGFSSGAGGGEMASQQILQALLQEMQYLRTQTIQPLRAEVSALQQQRELLLQEIHQLEASRQAAETSVLGSSGTIVPPSWIDEVVERVQAGLMRQLGSYLQSLPQRETIPIDLEDGGADLPQLQPQQRLEQVRQIQAQTDYLLLKLDSNLRAVFESMEQSIQSYRESLHQGLDTMHGLGQQGEVIFQALVNHLAQQVEQAGYLDRLEGAREGRISAASDRRRTSEGLAPRDRFRPDLNLEVLGQYSSAYGDEAEWAGQPESLEDTLDLDTIDLGSLPSARAGFLADGEATQWQLGDDSEIAADGPDPFNDPLLAGFDDEEDWSEEEDLTVFQGGISSLGESTVVQMEPISWEAIIGRTKGQDASAPEEDFRETEDEAAEEAEEYEELDALYESLFGNTLEGEAGGEDADNAGPQEESAGAGARGSDLDTPVAVELPLDSEPEEMVPDLAVILDPADLAPLDLPSDEEELSSWEGDEDTEDLSLSSEVVVDAAALLHSDQCEDPRLNLPVEEAAEAMIDLPLGEAERPASEPSEEVTEEAGDDEAADWALDMALLETASNWGGAAAPPTITLALPDEDSEGAGLEDQEEEGAEMASLPEVEDVGVEAVGETALEDWLFEGAVEPESSEPQAQASAVAAAEITAVIAPSQSQPSQSASPRSLADLFGEAGAAGFPETTEAAVPTTISALTELLPPPGAAGFREPSLEESLELADASDLFIAASPDENLLDIDDPEAVGPWNLELDLPEAALAQLDTDLLGLEGLATGEAAAPDGGVRTLEDVELFPGAETAGDFEVVPSLETAADPGSGNLAESYTQLTEPDSISAVMEEGGGLAWADGLEAEHWDGDPIPALEGTIETEPTAPVDALEELGNLANTLDSEANRAFVLLEAGEAAAEIPTLETLDSRQAGPISSQLPLVDPDDGVGGLQAGEGWAEEGLLPSVVELLGTDPLAAADLPTGVLGAEVLGEIPAPDLLMESLLGEGFDSSVDLPLVSNGETGTTIAPESPDVVEAFSQEAAAIAPVERAHPEALEEAQLSTEPIEAESSGDNEAWVELSMAPLEASDPIEALGEVNLSLDQDFSGASADLDIPRAATPLETEAVVELGVFDEEMAPVDAARSGEVNPEGAVLGEIAAFFDSEETPIAADVPIEIPDSIAIALGDDEEDWFSAADLLDPVDPAAALDLPTSRAGVSPAEGPGLVLTDETRGNFLDDAPSDEELLNDLAGVSDRLEASESLDFLGDWDGPSASPPASMPGEMDTGILLDTLLGDGFGDGSAIVSPNLEPTSDVAAPEEEGTAVEESDFRLDDFGDSLAVVSPSEEPLAPVIPPDLLAPGVEPTPDPLAALEGDLGLDLAALGLALPLDLEGGVAVPPEDADAFSLGELALNLSLEDEAIAKDVSSPGVEESDDMFPGDLSLDLSLDLPLEDEAIATPPSPAVATPTVGTDGPEIDLEPLPQGPDSELDISLEGLSGDGLDPLAELGMVGSAAVTTAELSSQPPLSLETLLGEGDTPLAELALLSLADESGGEPRETLASLDLGVLAQADANPRDASGPGIMTPPDTTLAVPQEEASELEAATALALENLAFAAEDLDLLATLAAPPPPAGSVPPVAPADAWYLGLDVGTTGLSAVLMNRTLGQAYPLYWSGSQKGPEMIFRLPAIATLLPGQGDQPWAVAATGMTALAPLPPRLPGHGDGPAPLSIRDFKAALGFGLAYEDERGNPQPLVQWDDHHALPLAVILESLQALLATITPPRAGQTGAIAAAGLSPAALTTALDTLQGVIVGDPTPSHDTYRFNIREVILAAGLVPTAEQIYFVDDGIAALLSGLPDPRSPLPSSHNQGLYQCAWQGSTVVISAGASQTQLGLVMLPPQLSDLKLEDVALRTLAYGGQALDLDIISHLLVPSDRRQPWDLHAPLPSHDAMHWSASLPERADPRWASLELEELALPRLGEGDPESRRRLFQRLIASPLGLALLEAARVLKITLQNQAQITLVVGDQMWQVLRRDLESRILVPYIQRINQQLNTLLSQTGLVPQGVNQVVCTGGNGSFSMVARWLRQKFPNATIIQDTYPSDRPPSCSRVAYGLANLCRYPQLLDTSSHQYSDFFLLRELLDTLPETPLTLEEVIAHLERQGVNGAACEARILALLNGQLPVGLGGDDEIRSCLSLATVDRAQYRALRLEPLLIRTGDRYTINPAQRDRLRQHLITLMVNKSQSLTEPLAIQWDGAIAPAAQP